MRLRSSGALQLSRGTSARAQQRGARQLSLRVVNSSVPVRRLGLVEYEPTFRAMQRFTDARDAASPDEIWLLEHPPVFTLGMNASREHLLAPGTIPVVEVDRGGQVTYHGPGQLVLYPLFDLRRLGIGIRELVVALEDAVIAYAARFGIAANGDRAAPGVYVNGAKLASVGLRVRRGASYHGLSLNVAMDLEPFRRINVCGHPGLAVTQLRDLGAPASVAKAGEAVAGALLEKFGFQPDYSAISTSSQAVSSR
ncbi:MAG: lipoyl(octanoyl) transferase LipB [Gammaproteobacteria bacterium]|nr:lipoyl(octanoyl) transferase LipB [Gammaproteobacteria bacterium]